MNKRDPVSLFRNALAFVRAHGYNREIDWYAERDFDDVTEQEFLTESAWVVLCSGFRETTVRRVFGYISWCFLDWASSEEIRQQADESVRLAMLRFRHEGKLRAIAEIARNVADRGFWVFKEAIRRQPAETLSSLPYIGQVTALHLAKNLGLPFAKPDRHLEMLCGFLGVQSVERLCADIASTVNMPVQVVDTVLWRFCVLGGMKSIRVKRATLASMA